MKDGDRKRNKKMGKNRWQIRNRNVKTRRKDKGIERERNNEREENQ